MKCPILNVLGLLICVFQLHAGTLNGYIDVDIDTAKVFNVVSAGSGKSMDVESHSTVNGAKIVQNTTAAVASQQWKVVNLANGYYQIINALSGKALSSSNDYNGTQLTLEEVQSSSLNQQWRLTNLGGKYAIISRTSGKAADVSGGSWNDNIPIIQWDEDALHKVNQQWLFKETKPVTPGDSAQYMQVTNLPCFYITTENSAAINSKDVYLKGQLVVAGGTVDKGYYNGEIEIRGRGNSTWNMAKKPYRIKLASKYNLLGMPAKEKNWVLLANYADKSLIRNALAFEISKYLGFKFTCSYRFADVYINGSYQGNYLVTDQVEVAESRVNVEKQETGDITSPAITGGYLLEVDGFASSEPVWFKTNQGVPITIKYPKDDEINQQQKAYISNYIQEFENALTGPDFKDSATGYRKYTNVASMVDYYILSELTGNADAFWSTYISKNRNQPKLFYGPVWDFDQAFYNNSQQGDVTYRHVADYAYDPKIWIRQMLKDDYFNLRVKNRLTPLIANLGNRLQFVTDSLSNLLQQSQKLNFEKWPILNSIVFREPAARGTYAKEVQFVKEYITNRFDWLKNQLKDIDTAKVFNIVSAGSGKSMDVESHSTVNGAKIVQNTTAAVASQQWKVVNLANGYYQIINALSGKALSSSNDYNGTQLTLEEVQSSSLNQQWRLTNLGGKYAIISRTSGKAADVSGGSWNDNIPIIQWDEDALHKVNQQWLFTETKPVTSGDSAQYMQVTNLPCFYITTENNAAINSKDVYLKGQLVVAGGTVDKGYYNGEIEIRGRGNSTWNMAKKPYRIKLASKYNLLGMPAKEKNWVLLANYADKSLIRNALAFEISKYLGFKFTCSYRFADVYINGSYQGNYLVTDQVEVAESRVNVEKQETGDITSPAITGGYLLEVDGFASSEPVWFKTNQGVPITIKYPKDDEINQQQKAYISNYIQEFENALTGPDFKDSATGYRKYTNVASMVDYYILSELTGNADAFWSTYISKNRNQPKLFYGPVWDFDQAFYNNSQQGDVTYRHVADYAYDPKIWIRQMLKDDYFNLRVKNRLTPLIANLGNRLQFVTDSLSNLLQQSQKLNFEKWPILNSIVFREPAARGTYAKEVQFVKEYITNRFDWLKNQLKDIDTAKIFNIISAGSGKSMDVESHSTVNGAKIVQNTTAAVASQQWKVVNLANGYYQIINTLSGKALSSSNDYNGTQLTLEEVQSSSLNQQWRLTNLGGKYAIISRTSGKAADVSGGSWNDNIPIIQWDEDALHKVNQQWLFKETKPVTPGGNTLARTSGQSSLVNFYPNPVMAGQRLSGEIELTQESKVTVMIYTKQSILLTREYKGIFQKGRHRFTIKIAGLHRGEYLVKITTMNEEVTQQLYIQ